ncbi:CDP-alcohol phosphatidyltransferase family protein [Salirhabdus salicampi]|uniref:CDP-alcohol phosphatidyltransferase family protein n=1 Tax=Salirhabdus salicampi TaxID=476102 RepID=UPI0020C45258|nr:CDP-alcohol phosphatidyltransferase family protein [Salirhabdus salicampi]MCP8616285.1 CDP-alcohol phosphatidyltransferase family protein [Salirhabdus salicampi]
MISIYQLKPSFQKILRPLTNKLATNGMTANQVTLFTMIMSIITGLLLYLFNEHIWIYFYIPIFLFIRMALNAIDGMLAKEHNMKSPLGNMLNELGDVISDSAIYLAFIVVTGFQPFVIVLVVLASIISEMAGVLGKSIGASRRYDGPMGKSDRAFIFSVISLLLGLQVPIFPFVNYVLLIVASLILLNTYIRVKHAVAEVTNL